MSMKDPSNQGDQFNPQTGRKKTVRHRRISDELKALMPGL